MTDRARRLLDEHGYGRVHIITADAAEPIPDLGEIDVVMVTAGAGTSPRPGPPSSSRAAGSSSRCGCAV